MNKKIPKDRLKEAKDIILYFKNIDPFVGITLKAHLRIESLLDEIINMFVFHPEFILKARLTFAQKIKLARSISLDQSKDSVWGIIILLNNIRNDAIHNIELKNKGKYIKKLDLFMHQQIKNDEFVKYNDSHKLELITAFCVGFLNQFKKEIGRFKDVTNDMDKIINSHRHSDSKTQIK